MWEKLLDDHILNKLENVVKKKSYLISHVNRKTKSSK